METANGLNDSSLNAVVIDICNINGNDYVDVAFADGSTVRYEPISHYRDLIAAHLIIVDDAEIRFNGEIADELLDTDITDQNGQTVNAHLTPWQAICKLFLQVSVHVTSDFQDFLKDLGLAP